MVEDPETQDHDQRLSLALTFILPEAGNRGEYLTRFVWMAAMNPTIQAEAINPEGGIVPEGVADGSIDDVIAAHWNQIAGVPHEAFPEQPLAELESPLLALAPTAGAGADGPDLDGS